MRLDESMVRVVRDSIGANGRAVTSRPFVAYVAEYAVKDARGKVRRFASQGAARDAARDYIRAHNEMEP